MSWLHQILERLQGLSSRVFLLLGALVFILASLTTISNGISILARHYRSSIGFKRNLHRQLRRLAAGVRIRYFEAILGPPAFCRTKREYREYTFVNKYCYVQAVTDPEGPVVLYSVTTRRSDFSPTLVLGPYTLDNRSLTIRLGRTRFAEVESFAKPRSITSTVGARRFYYYEEYYFGNPAKYQTFLLGISDAGYCHRDHPGIPVVGSKVIDSTAIREFRQNAVINTYTVTAPLQNAEVLLKGFWFGADRDQVRVVDPPVRRSRRELRRLKRVFEKGPYEYFKENPKPRMYW
jgi:hypothetical protein